MAGRRARTSSPHDPDDATTHRSPLQESRMKHLTDPLCITVSLAVLCALTCGAFAAERNRGPSGSFEGTIVRIAGNTFGVDTGSDSNSQNIVNFRVGKDTAISSGDKDGTLKDLAVGMHVKVKAG